MKNIVMIYEHMLLGIQPCCQHILHVCLCGRFPTQVEQPSTSVLVLMPYLQHVIAAMGGDNAKFKRLILGKQGICLCMFACYPYIYMYIMHCFYKYLVTMCIAYVLHCMKLVQCMLLSWMGLYGARSPKLSYLLGSPLGTQ